MKRESRSEDRESNRSEAGAEKNVGSTFEDLEVYQVAREFRKAMYCVTRALPDTEKFGLAAQMRRAALSLTNNIAEGHGRFHYLDQVKFMLQSRGSLQELIDDLNTCTDESYLPQTEILSLKEEAWRVRKLIDGYVRYLRLQTHIGTGYVRETAAVYVDEANSDLITDSRFSM